MSATPTCGNLSAMNLSSPLRLLALLIVFAATVAACSTVRAETAQLALGAPAPVLDPSTLRGFADSANLTASECEMAGYADSALYFRARADAFFDAANGLVLFPWLPTYRAAAQMQQLYWLMAVVGGYPSAFVLSFQAREDAFNQLADIVGEP